MISKSSQLKYRGRKHPKKYGVKKEAPLQKQLNDLLNLHNIPFFRIPDGFWSWLHGYSNATQGMKREISHYFAGWPDNIAFISLKPGICLALMLELKSKDGKLEKSQRKRDKKTPFVVSRTPEENIAYIEEFVKLADKLKGGLQDEAD